MIHSTCSLPDCNSQIEARGWCRKHYLRWWKHGDPHISLLNRRPENLTDEELSAWFSSKLKIVSGPLPTSCHLWTGAINSHGYGAVRFRKKTCVAHRVAWEVFVGPIPAGKVVCHIDDHNRLCCNPDHLYLGTPADNVADTIRLGNHWSQKQPKKVRVVDMSDTSTQTVNVDKIPTALWAEVKNLSNTLRAAGHPDWQIPKLMQRAIMLLLAEEKGTHAQTVANPGGNPNSQEGRKAGENDPPKAKATQKAYV